MSYFTCVQQILRPRERKLGLGMTPGENSVFLSYIFHQQPMAQVWLSELPYRDHYATDATITGISQSSQSEYSVACLLGHQPAGLWVLMKNVAYSMCNRFGRN